MNRQDPLRPARALPGALAGLLTLVFLAVLIRTAWLSDDALITLRTVLNFTHGFGLRFNIAERVQTFTHPLWMILITGVYWITSNIYFATFACSLIAAALAFWLALTRAASAWQAAAVAVLLLFSRAFVDFSTSGLENPLSYVLLALFVGVFVTPPERVASGFSRKIWLRRLWLLASLLYLTRPDDVLLVVPMLFAACWRVRQTRTIAASALVGLAPAVLWTLFALVYYGAPFPNTAYAKLAMGVDRSELWTQGVLYLIDSVDRDPVTLTAIAFAVILAFTQRRPAARPLACGVLVYLLYIVSIGGDFMAGRFLAVPLFAASLLLGRFTAPSRPFWIAAGVVFIAIGSAASHVTLWSNSTFGDSASKANGIVNERGVYFHDKSLVLARRSTFREPDWPRAHTPYPYIRVLDTCGLMGTASIEFGPYTHLLDECALADPLLARLPAIYTTTWRVGHYRRMIPEGYRETLETGLNQLRDRGLHDYYERLSLLTRGEHLWAAARLRTIVALNLGRFDHLLDRTFYRYDGAVMPLEKLAIARPDGTPDDAPGTYPVKEYVAVVCGERRGESHVNVSLSSDGRYVLEFLEGNRERSTLDLGPIPEYRRHPGLVTYDAEIPPRAAQKGFDTIVVMPAAGDHKVLGHLTLEP
jgi:arabinofuranosyltransferase